MNEIYNIIEDYYSPLLLKHGFIPEPENKQYGELGLCWRLSSQIGTGTYWTYGQKNLFNIKIHNFILHDDSMLDFSTTESLSITRYDSISGEELDPYRRLTPNCIKTYIGGHSPYRVLIHKRIPICSIGIEIMPSYYIDYLSQQYPGEYTNPLEAFRKLDQTTDFPEMSRLLTEVKNYRQKGIAAKLFYEGKVAEAVSLIVQQAELTKEKDTRQCKISSLDLRQIQIVTSYLNDHYPYDISLQQLSKLASMSTTKLKTLFKRINACTITEYIQHRRMGQAEYLLSNTDLSISQISQTVGYSNPSRFAELFRKNTGILPSQYRTLSRS